MKTLALAIFVTALLSSSSYAASPGFSFAEAQSAFKAGAAPTAALLNGSWKQIGVALPGSNPDKYDANGLKNDDGSYDTELQFEIQKDALSGASLLILNVAGLGSSFSAQGPFTVKISSAGLSFLTYGYDGSSVDEDTTYPRVCKVVQVTGALICHVDDSALDNYDITEEYDVYVRE